MYFSDDMKDLIKLFRKYDVLYVLVSGFAVNYYGYVRTTQDIDFLIFPSKKNAKKVMSALQEFGFGKAGIPQSYFEEPGNVIHLGVEPNRIDLLPHLVGIENKNFFSNFETAELDGVSLNIIAYDDLLKAKKSSKKLRDQADTEELEKSSNR